MLKKHLEKLTWYETSSTIEYTTKPQGVLNVVRMAQGYQDCWQKLTPTKIAKKKNLILADWWVGSWDTLMLTRIRALLAELLENGFTIYIWQDFDLVLLENITQLDELCFQIKPEYKDVIANVALKMHKLSSESILVMQHNELLDLMDAPDYENTTIPANYLLKTTHSIEKIKAIETAAPSFNTVILNDFFSQQPIDKLTLWPDIKQKKQYQFIVLDQNNKLHTSPDEAHLKLSISAVSNQSKDKVIGHTIVMSEPITQLTIDIDNVEQHPESLLHRLFTPSLKALDLINYFPSEITSEYQNANHLEFLRVMEFVEITELLIKASQATLKTLIINLNENYLNLEPDLTLNRLSNLHVGHCQSDDLAMLLEKSPNLVSLTLVDAYLDMPLPQSIQLEKLTSITIEGVCDAKALVSLLILASNCRYLNLTNATISGSLMRLDFPKIMYLYLNDHSANVLQLTSSIKKLFIYNSDLRGYGFVENLRLANLKTINIILSTQIKAQHLEPFTHAQPYLDSLTFNGCSTHRDSEYHLLLGDTTQTLSVNLENAFSVKAAFDAQNISSITLFMDTLSDQIGLNKIKYLLQSITQLKTLVISDYSNHFKSIHLINLPVSIEKLTLSSTYLSPATLKKIIYALPALKHLTFTDQEYHCCKEWLLDNELKTLLNHIEYVTWPKNDYNQYDRTYDMFVSSDNHSKDDSVCDINTEMDEDKNVNVNRIFYATTNAPHPSPTIYRLTTWNNLAFSKKDASFEYQNKGDLNLIRKKITYVEESALTNQNSDYLGLQVLRLNEQWQPIASLSPDETITHYSFSNTQAATAEKEQSPTQLTADIEIQYSKRDNLYYIRSLSGEKNITLRFAISVGDEFYRSTPENREICNLIMFFSSFTAGKLHLSEHNHSQKTILNAIMKQKVGACRHRAIAFMMLMQEKLPDYPVRIINNDCHSFVEIKQQDIWIRCDLGGYPTKLNINDLTAGELAHQQIGAAFKQQHHFESQFKTWSINHVPHKNNLPLYIQHLLNGEHKKQLIHINENDVLSLNIVIQQQACHSSHPVFYVHSPEDLVCSAPVIHREGNQGKISSKQGGGGLLHDFLTDIRHSCMENPILIVNYSRFSSNDIIRFNALLDEKRHADGTPVPENTVIIGLIDPEKPDAYSGADFYSRFDFIEQCPFSTFPVIEPVLKKMTDHEHIVNPLVINLCHQAHWLTQLMGGWILHQGQLQFETGALTTILYEKKGQLVSALESGRPIIIQNPPQDGAFELFWQQAKLHNTIDYQGVSYPFPADIQLFFSEGYHWSAPLKQLHWFPVEQSKYDEIILNPSTLSDFLNQYQFDQHGLFTKQAGWIKQHANGTVPFKILVTRTLSDDDWGVFFNELQKYPDLSIAISCTSNVSLPESFNHLRPMNVSSDLSEPSSDDSVSLPEENVIAIVSNDPDFTVHQLKNTYPDAIVIDISECQITDLVKRIHVHMENLKFVFSETEQALLIALKNNQPVILTGNFSDELLDNLAFFTRSRLAQRSDKGQLILIGKTSFECIPTPYYDNPTREDIAQELISAGFTELELNNLTEESPYYLQNEPFINLMSRLQFKRQYPEKTSQQAWDGLLELPLPQQFKPFDIASSKADASEFLNERLIAVNQILKNNPYLFLTGLTGVGKSQFVEQELKNRTIFHGESSINAWINATPDCQPTLFIDEANLSNKNWSEFEGLFQTPPGLLFNGKYHELTQQHKVIFAGNPLNYGDERKLPPLFQRHGHTLVFQPLPPAVIYETILKPILHHTLPLNDANIVANKLLSVYQCLIGMSSREMLVSPRQIQMMALATIAHRHQDSTTKIDTIALLHARSIALTLLPKKHIDQFNQYFPQPEPTSKSESRPSSYESHSLVANEALSLLLRHSMFHFKPINPPFITKSLVCHSECFLTTPSRKNAVWQLTHFLNLREFQRTTTIDNTFLRFGGLHRFVIEGEPGVGKSEMIIELITKSGIHEARLNDKAPHPYKNMFYRLAPSMQPSIQTAILLKAFDEGAIVLIDEINSMPTLENILNSLLDAKHPEDNNRAPHVPGFRVIGTQNPPRMAGRRLVSPALENRTQTIRLEPYPIEEMHAILNNMGLSSDITRNELINAYQTRVNEAKTKHLSPAPNFRDLIRIAKHVLDAQESSFTSRTKFHI